MGLFNKDPRQRDPALALFPGLDVSKPWWSRLPYVYWVPALLTGLLIGYAPLDASARWPALNAFCLAMLDWFPFLGNHAAYSTFPAYITTVKCVTFASVPLLVALPFVFVWRDVNKCLEARVLHGSPPIPWWNELVLLGLIALVLIDGWVIGEDPANCRVCLQTSVLGLAQFHAGAAIGLSTAPIAVFTSLYVRAGLAYYRQHGGKR